MTLADLQSNISISANNAVTGDIEWCSGYTQFSTDIGEQAGWYLALQVTPDVEDATVTAAYNGTIRELDNNIFIIRLADGEDTITFTAEKEGYTTGRLTLDLSGLNKETITNYCYVTSLTNGVTVTPLQFGESKQLSGVVPYDTTTSSNHFRLKYRTFIPIPAGSQISVSHFGTELGASTFNTVTPQEGESYSEAEVEITITQAILDSESPDLTTLIIPDTGEVLDRFYCSLGVENLTLEAEPVPDVSYLLDTNLKLGYVSSLDADILIPQANREQKSFLKYKPSPDSYTPSQFETTTITFSGVFYWNINLPSAYQDGTYCPVKITASTNAPNTFRAVYILNNIEYDITFNNNIGWALIPITSSSKVFSIKVYDTRNNTDYIYRTYTISGTLFAANSLIEMSYPTANTVYGNKTLEDIQSGSNQVFVEIGTTVPTNKVGPLDYSVSLPAQRLGLNDGDVISHYVSGWVYNNETMADGHYIILRVYKQNNSKPIYYNPTNKKGAWVAIATDTTKNYDDIILNIDNISDDQFSYHLSSLQSGTPNYTADGFYVQVYFNRVTREPYIAPAGNFVNNGSIITLNNTNALYKDAASTGTDTFQAGQYITNSTTNSSGSSYSGTSSAPYKVDVTANPVATDTWTAGFVITGGTNGNTPVLETGTTGTLSDWSVKMASDNKTVTITYHGTFTTYASAKVYYSAASGGTKHVVLTINPVT